MVVTFLQNRILNMTEEFRRGTFTQRCSQLSFGVLCLFLLECSITGGGRYWEVGPVSVRILLGGLAAVLALPELFRQAACAFLFFFSSHACHEAADFLCGFFFHACRDMGVHVQ